MKTSAHPSSFRDDETGVVGGRLLTYGVGRKRGGRFEHSFEELTELNRLRQARDIPALKIALRDYHERRKQLVPRIAAIVGERSHYLN